MGITFLCLLELNQYKSEVDSAKMYMLSPRETTQKVTKKYFKIIKIKVTKILTRKYSFNVKAAHLM